MRPAKERAERLEAEREDRPIPPTRAEKAAEASGVKQAAPARAYMVGVMVGVLGMSVADANAEYDRQLKAEEEKERVARG